MKTSPGSDIFAYSQDKWPDAENKVLFVCNQSSFNSEYIPTLDSLIKEGMKIDYLIAPEHGLYGFFQDMETFSDNRHPYYDIPVISIYNEQEKSLDIDKKYVFENSSVIYDVQDVGSRYYTFLWSLYRLMKIFSGDCSEIIILDRPNPIMPMSITGPPVQNGFESFVGEYSIPIIYGLTIGEFALYIKEKLGLDINLKIISMQNYSRGMFYDQTGIPWGYPSPNMPVLETAILYPGACLIEGTNISEGRGTTRPFSLIGAPFIKPDVFCRELKNTDNPGILFKPVYFRPMFSKYKNEICGGIEIAVDDRYNFRPVDFYLNIISTLIRLYPGMFAWRKERYEYREDIIAFDMLTGSGKTRKYLEKGVKTDNITGEWKAYENEFKNEIKNIMIYR